MAVSVRVLPCSSLAVVPLRRQPSSFCGRLRDAGATIDLVGPPPDWLPAPCQSVLALARVKLARGGASPKRYRERPDKAAYRAYHWPLFLRCLAPGAQPSSAPSATARWHVGLGSKREKQQPVMPVDRRKGSRNMARSTADQPREPAGETTALGSRITQKLFQP